MIFTKKFITSLLCISCSFLFIHSSSFGFVQTKTGSGLPLKWPNGFKVNFAGNPTNQSSIHPDYFFQVIAQGLQKWKSASGNAFNFDYWQGTSSSTYIQNSQYNGQSSIYFVSQSTDRMGLDSGVLGYTQVWYNTGSGEILETDIVLNDYNFFFTPNPQDSHFNQNSRRIFIENVVTHELGHVFGLSHSSALQDTMLYVEAPEQNTLSCNEWTGIRSIYATGSLGMGKFPVALLVKTTILFLEHMCMQFPLQEESYLQLQLQIKMETTHYQDLSLATTMSWQNPILLGELRFQNIIQTLIQTFAMAVRLVELF